MERPDLERLVFGELNARLERAGARLVAVALSGGGDSLALLLIAKAWADDAGRELVAFTVDHRLQAASADWAAWCAARAGRLGVAHRTLVWRGARLATPAAARAARHRLIAEAARAAGASVVLFGHTADDVFEAETMRAVGVRIGAPRPWSPSPVWPEGRDLYIARPLLGARRAEIRAWLTERGETWIEDPANADPAHPRAWARAEIAGDHIHATVDEPRLTPISAAAFGCAGDVQLFSSLAGDYPEFVDQLGAAVVCAAGGERPPRREALQRLAARLGEDAPLSATLGGARIVRAGSWIHITRETGDARGRRCETAILPVGEMLIWDGRFEVVANESGLTLAPLSGRTAKLGQDTRRRLSAMHPTVRRAMPAVIDADGGVACPTLTPDRRVMFRNLVPDRMAGACGVIDCEAEIGLLG